MASTESAKRASRKHYLKYREKWREYARRYQKERRLANPELYKQRVVEYRKKNPDKAKLWAKKSWIRRRFGIELEEYESLLASQNHRCLICGKDLTKTIGNSASANLALDHCHKTGKIRGFLCKQCNAGLGYFKDDWRLLRKAMHYLRGQ